VQTRCLAERRISLILIINAHVFKTMKLVVTATHPAQGDGYG
jgi:hypothetical protein